jgi:hypothetical protein
VQRVDFAEHSPKDATCVQILRNSRQKRQTTQDDFDVLGSRCVLAQAFRQKRGQLQCSNACSGCLGLGNIGGLKGADMANDSPKEAMLAGRA